ncbi:MULTISPECIES: dipeptidase [Aneurinibacillus]|uniref:Acetylornithine deacetylase/Succinyl-diaminopimelate desuccinylase n=1 Tax=Aneurinibacillus thermoaerophilus TaxID=143495 RepID=A0A1G8CG33_ANETH|nr:MULTISPECIES: dipeptidase [Aneurinibacillus]AMA71866.1 peptidase M20 [Aneurinibacillus sp. XH2]MED0674142.1 dipeptidase [Aneurinibacillus thermoaerophilus]MED0680460.1 dipeptidase [Aneurinibacillus thermoaerophilus]MED0737283.1 dipeptidase [Aneurinibacillus thermoaerophilus]MED0758612.1 dipeptidase [Aneurinibacillus thermoaerophilus]
MNQSYRTYLEKNRDAHLSELREFLSIPSISALSAHKSDIKRTAEWLVNALQAAGLENVQIISTEGNPIVYADWMHAENDVTALIYGHYDVQPVDPLELWQTPPFEPDIRDGKIYARGATDDKGQVFMHIKAVEALLKTEGKLPVNVKFCIEGEEEVGSPNLEPFVEKHKDMLAADVLVISDTPMLEKGKPAICYGLRGLCAMQIDVKGANGDLHSGIYGGGIANPLHALSEILASFHDKNGKVAIEGFYDKVKPLTKEERQAFRDLKYDEEALKKELGVNELYGEEGFNFLERTWARPTLEINGMYGGFQGEGIKTVLPSEAHAKISCRLVADQDPAEIQDLIERHVHKHTPPGVQVSLTRMDSGRPFQMPYNHPVIQAAMRAYEKAYNATPALTRMGGSIPIVEGFSRLLNIPVVLMGFGLPGENFHAPNEHFHLENFDKGMITICEYWGELSQIKQ